MSTAFLSGGCGSVVEQLSSVPESLGSIPLLEEWKKAVWGQFCVYCEVPCIGGSPLGLLRATDSFVPHCSSVAR